MVVGEHEPPALQRLLQQAGNLEVASPTPDNLWQAASFYCEAARLGSTEAQYRLGMLYAFGQGVPASRAYAAALFSQAATQGHAEAVRMLEATELANTQLPLCVTSLSAPEKSPAQNLTPNADLAALGITIDPTIEPAITRYLLGLPGHKRWLIPLTTSLSSWYELDPKLVLSVMAVESNMDVKAQSNKNATGLMQLIPGTAERFNVKDAFDATQNLRGGMRYLRWLLSYYRGNVLYALAAYNAGEGRVDRYKGVPPFPETRNYVKKIVGLYGSQKHGFDAKLAEAPAWLENSAR